MHNPYWSGYYDLRMSLFVFSLNRYFSTDTLQYTGLFTRGLLLIFFCRNQQYQWHKLLNQIYYLISFKSEIEVSCKSLL
jgi:hypothetical protein